MFAEVSSHTASIWDHYFMEETIRSHTVFGPRSTPQLCVQVISEGKCKSMMIINVYESKLHVINTTWWLVFCCLEWGHTSGNEASRMKDNRAWASSRVCSLWVYVVFHVFCTSAYRWQRAHWLWAQISYTVESSMLSVWI